MQFLVLVHRNTEMNLRLPNLWLLCRRSCVVLKLGLSPLLLLVLVVLVNMKRKKIRLVIV